VNVKKLVRTTMLIGVWAAVSWVLREKLLPLPRPEKGPIPQFRTGAGPSPSPPAAAAATPGATPTATPTAAPATAPVAGPHHPDDLADIVGIGPVFRGRLADTGITTFASLAATDAAVVAAAIGVTEQMVAGWIAQARERVR